jgi:hypothetical protein
VIILARMAYPIVWLLVAVAPPTAVGDALLFVALPLQGLAAGVENSNEMGYWQALTPDELLGRVNATRRSVNRTLLRPPRSPQHYRRCEKHPRGIDPRR